MATLSSVVDFWDGIGSFMVPASAGTLDGFRAWACSDAFPERGRISYIGDQMVFDICPEELETHVKVKGIIGSVISGLVAKAESGSFFGDGALVTNPSANVSTVPDSSYVSYESFKANRVQMIDRHARPGEFMELEGSPDWVLEIVSRSSVKKDTRLLRDAYHAAGIREYWLINALGEQIDFDILYHEPSGFEPAPEHDGWKHSRVFERSFKLDRDRDPLGYRRYKLHIR